MQIIAKTNKYTVPISIDYKMIDRSLIEVDKTLYADMCKSGCKNFNAKWSCPPVSPNFTSIRPSLKKALVIAFKLNTKVLGNDREFFKLTRAKAILEPRVTRLIRSLEGLIPNSYALINGSCHVCRKCSMPKPCIRPDKKRFSMEATGINCNSLLVRLFGYNLLWYSNKKCPEYIVGMALLLTNENIINCSKVLENDCGL